MQLPFSLPMNLHAVSSKTRLSSSINTPACTFQTQQLCLGTPLIESMTAFSKLSRSRLRLSLKWKQIASLTLPCKGRSWAAAAGEDDEADAAGTVDEEVTQCFLQYSRRR